MPNILIVDCFDSFTYNLYHYFDELNRGNCTVVRYDSFVPSNSLKYSHVVLSPGPGLPSDYPAIQEYFKLKHTGQNVLGVCLGHQCLAVYFKGKIVRLNQVQHGVSSKIILENSSMLYRNMEAQFNIGHYHSWVVADDDFPKDQLKVTSRSEDGYIMSLEHQSLPMYGLQFHPESIMTEGGKKMLGNWLNGLKSS